MGKHLAFSRRYEVEPEEHQPGCLWGMLHVLDYHQWQYLKKLQKLFYHRKHHPRRRHIRCCAAPKTISFTHHDAGKTEAEHLLGQDCIEEGKALGAKDISKKEIGKKRALDFHARKLKHDHQIDSDMGRTNPCSTKAEDELFRRILHNPHFGVLKYYTSDHAGIGKPRFTKARSFPLSDSFGARHHGASSLKHKQGEVWFSRGGDKLKIGMTNFLNDHEMSQVPFNATLKQETVGFSLGSSHALDIHKWNHLITSQFRGIKRRIKHALKERKGSLPVKRMVEHGSPSDDVKEISNDQVKAGKVQKMARLSSLNESLDKYARLFEESFSAESKASKLNHSKSLNLSVEDKISTPRTFRRRLSLPDHETLSSLLSDLSYDNLYSGLSARTKPESINSKALEFEGELLHDFQKTDSQEKPLEGSDATLITEGTSSIGEAIKDLCADGDVSGEISVESTSREQISFHGQEIAISSKSTSEVELSSPVSVLQSFLPRPSEGMDVRPCGALNEKNAFARNEAVDNLFKPDLKMAEEGECDFNFVKDVLRMGGFLENEFVESWDSIDLPLDPKIFDWMEAAELHGLECSDVYCVHQLLFDLINEALLDIYERNYTYFPRAFSSCRFSSRPNTKGQHLLEEVWTRVKLYRGMRHETGPTPDDTVSRDMAKGDGWMDLKWESECVALELEDMILDELVFKLIMHC